MTNTLIVNADIAINSIKYLGETAVISVFISRTHSTSVSLADSMVVLDAVTMQPLATSRGGGGGSGAGTIRPVDLSMRFADSMRIIEDLEFEPALTNGAERSIRVVLADELVSLYTAMGHLTLKVGGNTTVFVSIGRHLRECLSSRGKPKLKSF